MCSFIPSAYFTTWTGLMKAGKPYAGLHHQGLLWSSPPSSFLRITIVVAVMAASSARSTRLLLGGRGRIQELLLAASNDIFFLKGKMANHIETHCQTTTTVTAMNYSLPISRIVHQKSEVREVTLIVLLLLLIAHQYLSLISLKNSVKRTHL
jgi:hypothetical protein